MNRRELLMAAVATPAALCLPVPAPLTIDWGVVWRNIGLNTQLPLADGVHFGASGIWRSETFYYRGKRVVYPRWLYSPHYRSPFQVEKIA